MLDTLPEGSTYRSGINVCFKTCSDAKLANLLLDNEFPVHLFKQVFQLLQDPGFCLQDIAFKDIWGIYEHISDCQREAARERNSFPHPRHDNKPATLATTTSIVPPVALDLVVNRMLEDDIPLGMAAKDPSRKCVFARNGADFRDMSLVHRSWTSTAQNALRRRVVVPYEKIDRFLLSTLCGPWVREMIIYWTVDNGEIGVTESDILLLDALLRRTPNVQSLSFNTSLAWPRGYYCPPFRVDKCLEILSTRVPRLEHLWLKHFCPWSDNETESQESCNGMFSLCTHIPKFRSLQSLSIRSWTSPLQDGSPLDWDKHPPCRLKSIELDLDNVPDHVGIRREVLTWLLMSRNDFQLELLSIVDRLLVGSNSHTSDILGESLEEIFPEVVDLRLYFTRQLALNVLGTASSTWARRLRNCKKLSNLELVIEHWCNLDYFSPSGLPSSLKSLKIHCRRMDLQNLLSSRESVSKLSSNLEAALPRMPLLRNVLLTVIPRDPPMPIFAAASESAVMQELIDSFKEKHNIELSFI